MQRTDAPRHSGFVLAIDISRTNPIGPPCPLILHQRTPLAQFYSVDTWSCRNPMKLELQQGNNPSGSIFVQMLAQSGPQGGARGLLRAVCDSRPMENSAPI